MYHGPGQTTKWSNVLGEEIPPDKVDAIQYKYHMPSVKEEALLGNYWWIVRVRPMGTSRRYEYMVNKTYKFLSTQSEFARHKLSLASNRWYYDVPVDRTLVLCLYPYYKFCPGLGLDVAEANKRLCIDKLQYMEETKALPPHPLATSPSLRNEQKLEPHKTVQLLVDIGAIEDPTGDTLDQYSNSTSAK
jgi:hypothetical protein